MMNKSEIKERALTENTAQGVFKHLNDLESNRERMSSRWIWELLQNARDAANGKPATLVASVEHTEGELAFLHNGSGFTNDQVAHLIYHGSTKFELEDTIGQFGSGFLTTHLLSSQIDVSGFLNTGQSFEFRLERATGSIKSLGKLMDKAWEDFNPSDNPLTVDMPTEFTTRFAYTIGDDAADAVEKGIATLKQCAPYVVVFNPEFSAISIKSVTGTANFNVTDRKQLNENELQLVTVVETDGGTQLERQYLVASGEKSSVAFPLESVEGVSVCLPVDDTPRLFLGFPLVGTENFSFPAVINSFGFAPTENRDGVYLWRGSNQANTENEAVIEEACKLLVSLLQFAASSGWRNAYLLAEIPDIQGQSWLNSEQLRECLKERLIEVIRQTPAVLSEGGVIVSEESIMPFAEAESGNEGVENLWDLLDNMTEFHQKLPRRDESVGWCNSVESWAKIRGSKTTDFSEVIDGSKLAVHVEEKTIDSGEEYGRLSRLKTLFRQDVDAIEWLNQLCAFLKSNGFDNVIRTRSIILDQAGFLDKLSNLHRDQSISNKLKDIAESLEWNIRQELRDTQLTVLAEEIGAGNWDDNYVVGELIKRLQARAEKTPDAAFMQASVQLFTWIVESKNWELLRGFPVFSVVDHNRQVAVVHLPRNDQTDDRPLAPVKAWEKDLHIFMDLFPPNRILADAFFEALPDIDTWQMLSEQSIIRTEIVTFNSVKFSKFYPDYPLRDDVGHSIAEPVPMTYIWRSTDIIERVRDSQARARLFWRFLTEWLAPKDLGGLEIERAKCECGEEHRYYPSAWLELLRENNWIRMSNDARTRVSAQSLAHLLRGSGWELASLNENPAEVKLLEAIGVSRFDLVREFVSSSNEARAAVDDVFTNMLATAGGNIDRLSQAHQYLKDLEADPNLAQVVAERLEQVQRTRENQSLGDTVEDLVKQSLEGEGFTVERTGVGSDFEIEYDDVTRLKLARSNRSWLVEVKATRGQGVRITATQAKTAFEKGEGFLLCVVPVTGETAELELNDVRDNMRFVQNIGPRLAKICENLDTIDEFREDAMAESSNEVQLLIEAGTARVRVASSVWENEGFPLSQLVNRLK